MAHAFAETGYHTAYVGKWHLDGTNDRDHYVPPERRVECFENQLSPISDRNLDRCFRQPK